MRSVSAWLAGRRPAPPGKLAARMASTGPAESEVEGGVAEALARRGLEALDEARRAPGRVRESAFSLLTADALLTYACLAALETPDPEPFLEDLVGRSASPDR